MANGDGITQNTIEGPGVLSHCDVVGRKMNYWAAESAFDVSTYPKIQRRPPHPGS